MHIGIFSGGKVTWSALVAKELMTADMIIAADSGARTALEYGLIPQVVIGDFDSLDTKTKDMLKKKGCDFLGYPQEKDETDTQLAMEYAVKKGATRITIVGGNDGDRIDHVLSNILLASQSSIPITFANGVQKIWCNKGPIRITISGDKGDLLSLIPLSPTVNGITTKNLQYPLKKESLRFGQPRGISNVFTSKTANIAWEEGLLLFVQTSTK